MPTNPSSHSVAPGQPTNAPIGPAPRPHWLRWSVIAVIALGLSYLIFVRPFRVPAGSARTAFENRPVPVTAEPARKTDLNARLISLGTVTPVYTVSVHSRVDGELQKIFFTEGTDIEAGAPLADLDARPFQVQKLQAEAQLAKDHALLDNARLDLARYQTLLDQDSVAKQQVDSQGALVRQYEATIKVDQAQIASAALQLAYTHITAPITGRIGLRLVDQGNIVRASDTNGIAVITQLKPITVIFSIPQDALPKVLAQFDTNEPMSVEALASDGRTLLATGKLVTVDNQIDPTTGTVKLRAEFANTDEKLFPNQFVNVQLIVDKIVGATVVPNGAVQRGTVGNFVYIVSAQKTVSVRPVETGPSERGMIMISKGLSPGEIVVVDGIDKLREGSAVELIVPSTGAPAGAGATAEPDKTRGGHKPAGTGAPQN